MAERDVYSYLTASRKTEPIIDHYRKQNVLVEVDGNDTVENIFKNRNQNNISI